MKDPDPATTRGVVCPACGCRHFFVIDTRVVVGNRVVQSRACRHCGRRITTTQRSPANRARKCGTR